MFSENWIKSKSVGAVRIFEISGRFSGEFVYRGRDAMKNSLRARMSKNLLFNLSGLKDIDEVGVKTILNISPSVKKCVVLKTDCGIREHFFTNESMHQVKFMDHEIDAVNYLASEFVESYLPEDEKSDKRNFIRLKTALPLEIAYRDGNDRKERFFFGIVTNLSEGGVYVEFIESRMEEEARKHLNPFDLKLLDLKLYLSKTDCIQAHGKIIHGSVSDGGIGFEFYDLPESPRRLLRDWVANQIISCEGTKA